MINIAIKLATSITYTADGSQTNFSVPFDYLRPAFVHVAINDAEVSEGFTISNRMIMFDSAPAKDSIVHIYRNTPTTRLVSWADASILKAKDMTISEVQQLHILEEASDWSKTNSIVLDEESGVWQGRKFRVSNIADPKDAQDAVTKNYIDNEESSMMQRMNAIKTQTEQLMNTAGNHKDNAYNSAQSASTSAASAAESARLAEGYKNVAETAKSDASLYAANAKTSADNAGASKEAAQSAATTASNFASDARNSAGEAKTYKDNAKTYMDNAKNYSENVNVFVPSVSTEGVLSWTNKAGLTNPASVNIKGAKGDTGTAASITIGSVTTGVAGSNASVTNSGTASNVVLNFMLPRGKDGKDGGITVDAALSDTSINPVQNKVINKKIKLLTLPDGMLTTPSSTDAYVSKLSADVLAPINDAVHMVIEQSADGVVWETLFDSESSTDTNYKTAYFNGLRLPSMLDVIRGYMARITFTVKKSTLYLSSVSFFMLSLRSNDTAGNHYKCYYGYDALSSAVKVESEIQTWGSWVSAILGDIKYNTIQYVFNEERDASARLSFGGALCKGTVPYRNTLNFDMNNLRTSTSFPLEAPNFIGKVNGFDVKASVPANAKFINNEDSNVWTALQTFNDVVLNREKYTTHVVASTSDKPITSTMVYAVTGAFTLNLATLAGALKASESSVFTAYFAANADYSLTINNAGKLKYVGSASDVAITSAGLLLNIWMSKDGGGTLTSIVQASKLS